MRSKIRNSKSKARSRSPQVGIIMGSDSDWPTMKLAADACAEFGVPYQARVVSAHRTPADMARYAPTAAGRGLKVIIAGAGGAAHLPGMVASFTRFRYDQIMRLGWKIFIPVTLVWLLLVGGLMQTSWNLLK